MATTEKEIAEIIIKGIETIQMVVKELEYLIEKLLKILEEDRYDEARAAIRKLYNIG